MLGQLPDGLDDGVSNGLCAVSGQCGTVLGSRRVAVALQPRKVQQHREPGRALDQCSDGGAVEPQDEIAFPVPGDSAICDLGRSLADHDLRADELLAPLSSACPRHA
jgi:hypothetical protein